MGRDMKRLAAMANAAGFNGVNLTSEGVAETPASRNTEPLAALNQEEKTAPAPKAKKEPVTKESEKRGERTAQKAAAKTEPKPEEGITAHKWVAEKKNKEKSERFVGLRMPESLYKRLESTAKEGNYKSVSALLLDILDKSLPN